MASTTLLSKTSVRTAGVLTLSGLMVGGVVLSQGADAAPETQAVSQVNPVASLHSVDAQIDYVPAGLARPAVAPKSHQQIAAEKKAAADAAKAEADAKKQADEAQKKQEQERKQQEADAAKAASEKKEAAEQAASSEQSAAQEATPVTDTVSTKDSAPQASTQKAQASSGSTAGSVAKSSGTTQSSDDSDDIDSSGNYNRAAVVQAARHQIGVHQDCTALVTNSLRAAGINFHGWPKDYLSLGHTVSSSQAQPGDIIYYASNGFGGSHVAIYLGNGRAIHGGWEGGTTAEFSAYLPAASSPVFIHVDR